jgi:hypothetical protein
MGLLDRIGPRKNEPDAPANGASAPVDDALFPTKALKKFLACLTARESPVLLDLGPVVGTSVSFFGEQLGCKIFVQDIFADLDRSVREGKQADFAKALAGRFTQETASVDGILCWDLIDYLDRESAKVLAAELMRVLRPDGALLGFFGTAQARDSCYTKFIIVDDTTLRHRPYAAARGRQVILLNRDIIKLFSGLRVSDSFLLKNNLREILFRKPA